MSYHLTITGPRGRERWFVNRVFPYHTKLAMLPVKVYAGKDKQKHYSAKKLSSLGIEPGTSCDLKLCLVDWAYLTLLVRLIPSRSLSSHTLLILAESSKSEIQLGHKQKVQYLLEVNSAVLFLLNYCRHVQFCIIMRKLDYIHSFLSPPYWK